MNKPDETQKLVQVVEISEVARRVTQLENHTLDRHTKFITIIFSSMAGLVAVCAILVTVIGWLSRTESREATKSMTEEVRRAQTDMETRFQKLSGEALKRPKLQIFTQTGLLDGQVFETRPGAPINAGTVFIRNVGNKKTEQLSIRLFCNHDPSPAGGEGPWEKLPSSDKEFSVSYYARFMGIVSIDAGEDWIFSQGFAFSLFGTTNILCKLQVFYGGDAPAESRFTIRAKQ